MAVSSLKESKQIHRSVAVALGRGAAGALGLLRRAVVKEEKTDAKLAEKCPQAAW